MPDIVINKKYDENNFSSLVTKLSFVFRLRQQKVPGYNILFKFDNKKDVTALTSLIVYKFISFVLDENCLLNPQTDFDEYADYFSKYNIQELIASYFNDKDVERIYARIKPVTEREFFVAPHPISRLVIKNKDELDSKYYNTIQDYYKPINSDIVDYIKTCIVEISSNFYYHALDKKSILMAEGNKSRVEIVSIDTSDGIIETLRSKYPRLKDVELLKMAFRKNVTSKIDKGHCGIGLWLVNEIVSQLNGKFIVHTGGYVYRNIQGKISTFASSFWQGTIIYVKIPITEVTAMEDFLAELLNKDKRYIYAN